MELYVYSVQEDLMWSDVSPAASQRYLRFLLWIVTFYNLSPAAAVSHRLRDISYSVRFERRFMSAMCRMISPTIINHSASCDSEVCTLTTKVSDNKMSIESCIWTTCDVLRFSKKAFFVIIWSFLHWPQVWTCTDMDKCFFCEMQADRPTDRDTGSLITILRTPWVEVMKNKAIDVCALGMTNDFNRGVSVD